MHSQFPSLPLLLRSRKLHIVPMIADGNCFYRAICTAYYKDAIMHHLLRRTTMERMLEMQDFYGPYFPSKASFHGKLNANKRLGVWNSDLADLVPHAVAQLLGCCIEVYNHVGSPGIDDDEIDTQTEIHVYSFGQGEKIRLLRTDNHYDLLLKK